jgi:hypothetical protein
MSIGEPGTVEQAASYPGTDAIAPEAVSRWRELHYLPAYPADLLRPDPARREAVRFDSDGYELAGHLYRPPGVGRREWTAGVVMVGRASSVKEQTLAALRRAVRRCRLHGAGVRFAKLR